MSPEQPSTAAWGPRSLSRLLSFIRFDEVLVLQGSPLLGAVFSIGRLTGERAVLLAIFAGGNFCLLAHVFTLNDWAGMDADSRDPNRTIGAFITEGIRHTETRYLWMALLALSLLLLGPFGSQTLIIALAITGCRVALKNRISALGGRLVYLQGVLRGAECI